MADTILRSHRDAGRPQHPHYWNAQKLPLRVISWDNEDALAATDFNESTSFHMPDTEISKTIHESEILNMLLAKAFEDHYGKSRDEEKNAVAKFLMGMYVFDATCKGAQISPEETSKRLSTDDSEVTMKQEEVHTVLIRRPRH
ncbi:uncharacterized protein M421DRAFT_4783 [Didymella exigua CBS 183.55]|uniref:Uncharacterized protein n=1 Tax=Didymella exigua CBS 183.55 TaxID=1150837 RepID=A0A6A5RKL2_9PLEO|nr:uncharacterized protein M421DRAFT_4783 [Didymella exigua CBS 183.55]KAF1928961.1 hypothetical protein M421DRAFT_4783 [Didymella exigua CBS 183.55]